MALKLVLDSLDGVDDAVKALYTEDGGKFRLAVDGVEDTSGLKTALSKANQEAAERRKQLKSWNDLGLSPEEIQDLVEAKRKSDEDKAAKAGEWDKLKVQLNASHQEELRKERELVAAKDKAIQKHLLDSQATAAIAAAKGVPQLLLPIVRQHLRVVEQNGDYSLQVIDAAGTQRINGKGDPLSINDLVAEMRASEVYGRAFDGTGQSGGGTPPSGNGSGARGPKSQADILAPAKGDKHLERKLRVAFIESTGDGGKSWLALPKV